ncbi:MAG: hypothetical protein EZS28_005771 [Streblomastix strix]|uniref:Inositol-pentakisphosphate 2-kinase n=1 Tax=Streblomastix strix TaxID=222440 RepID=A0A5J4WWM4_9EUKA|nr:MAG: hypothetical protein EZS28_005771 [Streblomastix strix]
MQGFDGMNWDGIAGKDKVKYKERWGDLVEDEIEDQCTLNEHNILNDCKMVCEDQCSSLTNEDQQLKECVSQIRRYLVADSAKDCSIVLRFQPIEDENPEKQQSSEHSKVLCGINVIDLAPKVHKRISRWVKLERRLGLVLGPPISWRLKTPQIIAQVIQMN